ncbi:Uncharacterised protein [Mycobacteroides abscessus]|nr:Uncharacterised protein [Mycobacteroides abscessus]CPX69779.1 Uncharacterised protein [Mycobacteroides abscessus]CPZ76505.1 Uncharacterised protein [Mycobacteroides abscessus]
MDDVDESTIIIEYHYRVFSRAWKQDFDRFATDLTGHL